MPGADTFTSNKRRLVVESSPTSLTNEILTSPLVSVYELHLQLQMLVSSAEFDMLDIPKLTPTATAIQKHGCEQAERMRQRGNTKVLRKQMAERERSERMRCATEPYKNQGHLRPTGRRPRRRRSIGKGQTAFDLRPAD